MLDRMKKVVTWVSVALLGLLSLALVFKALVTKKVLGRATKTREQAAHNEGRIDQINQRGETLDAEFEVLDTELKSTEEPEKVDIHDISELRDAWQKELDEHS